jgi:hypothetical protein
MYDAYKLETLQFMAPERLPGDLFLPTIIDDPSEASDVYSFAMTSFEVRSPVVKHPTIWYDHFIMTRSSHGY